MLVTTDLKHLSEDHFTQEVMGVKCLAFSHAVQPYIPFHLLPSHSPGRLCRLPHKSSFFTYPTVFLGLRSSLSKSLTWCQQLQDSELQDKYFTDNFSDVWQNSSDQWWQISWHLQPQIYQQWYNPLIPHRVNSVFLIKPLVTKLLKSWEACDSGLRTSARNNPTQKGSTMST